MQGRSNSIANALELRLSSINPFDNLYLPWQELLLMTWRLVNRKDTTSSHSTDLAILEYSPYSTRRAKTDFDFTANVSKPINGCILQIISKMHRTDIYGLVQDCSNSIANALELLQSCIKPSISLFRHDNTSHPIMNDWAIRVTYLHWSVWYNL